MTLDAKHLESTCEEIREEIVIANEKNISEIKKEFHLKHIEYKVALKPKRTPGFLHEKCRNPVDAPFVLRKAGR